MKSLFFSSIIIIILLTLFLPFTLAIGISPPQHEINFEPGKTVSFSHIIINNRDIPMKALINISGGLAPYIELEKNEIAIGAQSTSTVNYKIRMPSKLTPGWNYADIRVLDNSRRGSGMFSIAVAVVGRLKVFSPYPELYAVGNLYVPNINEGDDLYYNVTIYNQGEKNITDASLQLSFLFLNGNVIKKIDFDKISISSMESYSVADYLPAEDFKKGVYIANADFDYGNKNNPVNLNSTFFVGSYDIEITNHSNTIYAGQITPFKVDIRSNWNGPISNVYSTLRIKGISYNSLETGLSPFGTATLTSYIDDTSFAVGEKHTADLTIYYGGSNISKIIELDVLEWKNLITPIEVAPATDLPIIIEEKSIIKTLLSSPTVLLTLCVIVLVIINLLLFLRKKDNIRGNSNTNTTTTTTNDNDINSNKSDKNNKSTNNKVK